MILLLLKRIDSLCYYMIKYPVYRMLFKSMGAQTRILKPLRIDGYGNISLGKKVVIGKYTWLACLPLTGKTAVKLVIDDEAVIGNFNHIYATESIVIEKGVLTADKVYISDNLHEYSQTDVPVMKQPIRQLGAVTIGEGSWIGENVCIFGASVGKHCVIGANSVVNKPIPDYCVAAGSPAKVIKRFCFTTNTWKKVDNNGNFTNE